MKVRLIYMSTFFIFIFLLFQLSGFLDQGCAGSPMCDRILKEAEMQGKEGKYEKALDLFSRALEDKECTDLKCEAYFGRGRIKDLMNDLNGAVSDYEKTLQCRPASAEFREALGKIYFKRGNQRERLGDMKGAYGDYEKALQKNPELRDAAIGLSQIHYSRGQVDQKNGKLNSAAENYRMALKFDPQNREASEALNDIEQIKYHKSKQRDGLFTF